MIYGIISDTHEDAMNAIPHIVVEFKKRGVERIIHCGDIIASHLKPELFGGLPVVCALIKSQIDQPEFNDPPTGWIFTKPNNRVVPLGGSYLAYVGHATSFEFFTGSEAKLELKLHEVRSQHDDVRWFFSGHTHHQIYKQGHLVNFVNPGAVEDGFDGYEFAVINTDTLEIVFCRIPKTPPIKKTFSVGVISDSFDISDMDPNFWPKLVKELEKRGVQHVIHCGNVSLKDIGHKSFENMQVYYYLRPDQVFKTEYPNWHLIQTGTPVVDIDGYKFCVQLELGADLEEKSEPQMHKLCLGLRRKYPEILYVLCGLTNHAFLEEGEEVRIINPGGIVIGNRNYAVICMPRAEITFGHVPVDPLPSIK